MQDWSCATLRGLCAPEALAQSQQEPGAARLWQKAVREPRGTGLAPPALCEGAGTARPPPGQQGPGEGSHAWDTAHSCCGWEGSSVEPSGVEWDGQGTWGKAMGQSREGTAVPPSHDGIAGMAPSQGRGIGVPSLHRDVQRVSPLPWQCPLWLRALSPSWQPREKESSGPVPQGTLPPGHSLPEPPVLQPAQLTCQVRQGAHGAGHAGSALPWQLQCAVL